MLNKILLIFLIVLNISCSDSVLKKNNLRKLSDKELIQRAAENKYYSENLDNITYRDSLLNVISVSDLEKYPNLHEWTVDHYVN